MPPAREVRVGWMLSPFPISQVTPVAISERSRVQAAYELMLVSGSVLMSWIFIGAICFGIFREYNHFLLVRQEYLSSPAHACTPQATTVLITQIPQSLLNEESMRKLFGKYPGGIKELFFNRSLKELEKQIEERDKVAYKLEAAQIKVIKMANEAHAKSKTGGKGDQAHLTDSEEGRGTISQYVPANKRPSHKLGFLGLIGKKVYTIDWCTTELNRLNPKIDELQSDPGRHKMMNSCFIQFHSQAAAQMCFQVVVSDRAYSMHPRYAEVAPQDIIWSNMGLTWQMRMLKSTLASAFVVALVIFWAIPVAFVGVLSNITYLTDNVTFLRFILNCPDVLLGLITAYLPTILLAVLMALLPIILRLCAKISGIPTKSGVEYAVSNSYFFFLVVQVFLVVTVISSATAAVTQIINDPTSATTILAAKLPTSSNFYISYILLQGLAVSAGALAQVVGLIVFYVLGKILDGTPRKKWARWNNLSSVGFGTLFPQFTFLAMLTLTYSVIAPLIMIFSALAFGTFYLAYKHNFLYVYALKTSTMGLLYPRALQQTMVGLYFMEVCMIGLVAIGKSFGSIVLMVIALIATIFFHIKLNNAFGPLMNVMPIMGAAHESQPGATELDDMTYAGREGRDSPFDDTEAHVMHGVKRKPAPSLPIKHNVGLESTSYTHAALTAKCPALWLPTDALGVSTEEIARTRRDAKITVQEGGAHVDEKGNLTWDRETAPVDFDIRQRDIEL